MISERTIRLYSKIYLIGELFTGCICTPFFWNDRLKRVELTSGIQYFFYKVLIFSLCIISMFITYRLLKAIFMESVEAMGVAVAIGYVALLWIASCLMVLITRRRQDYADFINNIFRLDKILKRVFPGAFLASLETQQKQHIKVEHLLKLIVICHCTLNWSLMIAFYQKFDPFHRFFVEYLGVEPEINMMFLPFAGGEAWVGYMIAYTFAVPISSGLIYCTVELWMQSLGKCIEPHVRATRVDSYTQGKAYLRFYRCHQVLSRYCYECYASPLATVHHLGLLIAHIGANYSILSPSSDSDIMKVVLICAIPFGYIATYNEVAYISKVTSASNTFLIKSRVRFGFSGYLKRGFKSCRPIQIWTGYPFFCITSKMFFGRFCKLVVEQTINLKLSLP